MKILKNIRLKDYVSHIEKLNENTILTGEYSGYIELINKKDLNCLSHLQLDGVEGIN